MFDLFRSPASGFGFTTDRAVTSLKAGAGFAVATFVTIHVMPAWLIAATVFVGVFLFVWRQEGRA